jgi:hypothetical protein
MISTLINYFMLEIQGSKTWKEPRQVFNKSVIKKVKKKSLLVLDINIFLAYIGLSKSRQMPGFK